MNMKNCRNLLLAAAVLVAASSCSDKVQVKGTLAGAPDTQVVVKHAGDLGHPQDGRFGSIFLQD